MAKSNIKTIDSFGIDLLVKATRKAYLINTKSVLIAFSETKESLKAWQESSGNTNTDRWLNQDQLLDLVHFFAEKHNTQARDWISAAFKAGVAASPESLSQAQGVVEECLAESGDSIIDMEKWVHPLYEVSTIRGEEMLNLYGVVTLLLQKASTDPEFSQSLVKELMSFNPMLSVAHLQDLLKLPLLSKRLELSTLLVQSLEKNLDIAHS